MADDVTHAHHCVDEPHVCAERGSHRCECGATVPLGKLEWELPRVLVLRLDSRMAILLNQFASAACELVNGNYQTAALVSQHIRRFGSRNPEARQQLLKAISALVEEVPDDVLEKEGMSRYSSNELRYKAGQQ